VTIKTPHCHLSLPVTLPASFSSLPIYCLRRNSHFFTNFSPLVLRAVPNTVIVGRHCRSSFSRPTTSTTPATIGMAWQAILYFWLVSADNVDRMSAHAPHGSSLSVDNDEPCGGAFIELSAMSGRNSTKWRKYRRSRCKTQLPRYSMPVNSRSHNGIHLEPISCVDSACRRQLPA